MKTNALVVFYGYVDALSKTKMAGIPTETQYNRYVTPPTDAAEIVKKKLYEINRKMAAIITL